MRRIRVLAVKGAPYERGYAHGRAYREDIRAYAAERVRLVAGGQWSGRPLPTSEVLALATACEPAHRAYAPDLMQEVDGLAAATGLSVAELIIVSGFTDFVDTVYNAYHPATDPELPAGARPFVPLDDCTAFIVPDGAASGAGFFGQTWDMHDSAEEYVILLDVQPDDGPAALVFTTTGCVGQIGMNAHGIAVGITNLMGADGQIGVTWPFVVRKVLQQDNIDDALACITDAPLAGAHSYLLFDHTGRGYSVEGMSTVTHVTPLADEPLVHTNHCLFDATLAVAQARPPELQASTENRLRRADALLRQRPITPETLMDVTRDPEAICVRSKPPWHISSCGAAIMRPKTGEMWAVWGLPAENAYERFEV